MWGRCMPAAAAAPTHASGNAAAHAPTTPRPHLHAVLRHRVVVAVLVVQRVAHLRGPGAWCRGAGSRHPRAQHEVQLAANLAQAACAQREARAPPTISRSSSFSSPARRSSSTQSLICSGGRQAAPRSQTSAGRARERAGAAWPPVHAHVHTAGLPVQHLPRGMQYGWLPMRRRATLLLVRYSTRRLASFSVPLCAVQAQVGSRLQHVRLPSAHADPRHTPGACMLSRGRFVNHAPSTWLSHQLLDAVVAQPQFVQRLTDRLHVLNLRAPGSCIRGTQARPAAALAKAWHRWLPAVRGAGAGPPGTLHAGPLRAFFMRLRPRLRIFRLSMPARLLIFSMLLVDSARCLHACSRQHRQRRVPCNGVQHDLACTALRARHAGLLGTACVRQLCNEHPAARVPGAAVPIQLPGCGTSAWAVDSPCRRRGCSAHPLAGLERGQRCVHLLNGWALPVQLNLCVWVVASAFDEAPQGAWAHAIPQASAALHLFRLGCNDATRLLQLLQRILDGRGLCHVCCCCCWCCCRFCRWWWCCCCRSARCVHAVQATPVSARVAARQPPQTRGA